MFLEHRRDSSRNDQVVGVGRELYISETKGLTPMYIEAKVKTRRSRSVAKYTDARRYCQASLLYE